MHTHTIHTCALGNKLIVLYSDLYYICMRLIYIQCLFLTCSLDYRPVHLLLEAVNFICPFTYKKIQWKKQAHLMVHLVAALELLIMSPNFHQQLSWNCRCPNFHFFPSTLRTLEFILETTVETNTVTTMSF